LPFSSEGCGKLQFNRKNDWQWKTPDLAKFELQNIIKEK
jgi:hypothetical protein